MPRKTLQSQNTRSKWVFIGDVAGRATYHVGDEAMLDANLALFRRLIPDLHAVVVSHAPDFSKMHYQTDAVPVLGFAAFDPEEYERRLADVLAGELPAALAAVQSADGVVISGGGNLSSSWPHLIFERLALCRAARLRNIPVVILGQTIGPCLADRDRQWVAEILTSAAWVGVREPSSYALALDLGVLPEALSYQCDDSVSLLHEKTDDRGIVELTTPDARPWIGVTIHPVGGPDGDRWIADLASELNDIAEHTGARLVFIPHVAAVDDDTPGDQSVGHALARRMKPGAMTICNMLTARQTAWLTGHAGLIISTRYHPVVFGLTAGVPCLALWSDQYTRVKLAGALIHAGRLRDGCDLFALKTGELTERASALWATRREVGSRIQARAAQWRSDQSRRAEALGATLRRTAAPSPSGPADAADPQTIVAHLSQALLGSIHYCDQAQRRTGLANVEAGRYASALESDRDNALRFAGTLEVARDESVLYAKTLEAGRDESVRYAKSLEAACDESALYAKTLEAARDAAMNEALSQKQHADKLQTALSEAEFYAATLAAEVDRIKAAAEADMTARDAQFLEVEQYAISLRSELDRR